MNHFINKKFNLIKFGKGAIAVSSLALPALISTTANAMVRNPRAVSTLFTTLGRGTSSSSSVRSINSLRISNPSSTGISNPTTTRPNLTGSDYKKMASINAGGNSSMINARINTLQSSITPTTSTPIPLPIPKGSVTNMREMFNNTFHATLSSGFSNNTSPSGNVTRLSQRFTSTTTSTTSPTSSGKTSAPSGTGNVARLSQRFASSTTGTSSPSSSSKSSSSTGKVASIRKMFGD